MKNLQAALLVASLSLCPAVFASSSSSEEVHQGSYEKQVPELDAGAAGLSLGLVLAVSALIRNRRKQH